MPPANIHATVRRLIADGLVKTEASPTDRRLTLVDLTEAGRARLCEVLPAATAANANTLAALADDEQDLLMSLLRTLASSAELTATSRTSATRSSGLRLPSR
jgi:DNA-binding MarR family transcriptional regulator